MIKLDQHPQPETHRVGLVQTQKVTLFHPPEVLKLECGRELGPIEVAYETYGRLNEARDNAVLICHALTGDAHAAGFHAESDPRPGWWDIMIGPGKGIDTNRYFVICSNILGGCKGTTGPSSLNPATGRPWGLDFPVITVDDMVKVQKRLVEHLGIERLLAVIGGSMGGMQVLEWTRRYPQSVKAAIPIATTPRLNAQSIAFDAVGRNAILADPNFEGGQYHAGPGPHQGLGIARMVGHITYLSEEGMHRKFGRQLRGADRYRYDFTSEFSVETYLDYQGRTFVERFDANSYLYITKAMDYYDLTTRGENLAEALRGAEAYFLVISFSSDWLFPSAQSWQIVSALQETGKHVSYYEIVSPYGHDAFLLEPEILGRLIRAHLASASGHPLRNGGNGRVSAEVTPVSRGRVDYAYIEELLSPGSRVVDLGCGNGLLLGRLRKTRQTRGLGIELDAEAAAECLERGLEIMHGDLESVLPRLPADYCDYVVLSQTLQTLHRPDIILREMLRLAPVGIVSFPNCAQWRRRLKLLLTGRAPVSVEDAAWYDTGDLRSLSLRDFLDYCDKHQIRVLRTFALHADSGRMIRWWPNLRAEQHICVIGRPA